MHVHMFIYMYLMQGLLLIGAWKHHMKSCTYIHMYTRVYKYINTCIYIYISKYTCIYCCTTNVNTNMCPPAWCSLLGSCDHSLKIYKYTRVYKYTYIHVYTYTYPNIRVHIFVLQISTQICVHVHGVPSLAVAIIV